MNESVSNTSVHISQFYPCSKIDLGSELFYVCELGKYLSDYGKCISLDGVILDNVLKKSRFWDYMRVAVENGWLVDVGVDKFELEISYQNQIDLDHVNNIHITEDEVTLDSDELIKRRNDSMYDWRTPKETQVSFYRKDNKVWGWKINGDSSSGYSANQALLSAKFSSQSWVSLVAYVAVHRFETGIPEIFGIEFDSAVIVNKALSVVDILLLMTDTDAMNGWAVVRFDVPDRVNLQLGYEAWWYRGYEQGFLRQEYSSSEKKKYLNEIGIKVGDVVILYDRDLCQKNNYIKSITSMHFAVVRDVDKLGVSLEILNNKKTRYGAEVWFNSLTEAVQKMYNGTTSYMDYRPTLKTFPWSDLGVNYMMWSEAEFITALQLDDSAVLNVSDGKDRCDTLLLPEKEVIYWILKDYDVKFNEERFRDLYYKSDELPAYDRYQNGDELTEFKYEESEQ